MRYGGELGGSGRQSKINSFPFSGKTNEKFLAGVMWEPPVGTGGLSLTFLWRIQGLFDGSFKITFTLNPKAVCDDLTIATDEESLRQEPQAAVRIAHGVVSH